MPNDKINNSESHVKTMHSRGTEFNDSGTSVPPTLSLDFNTQSIRNWVPQIPAWMYLVAVLAGILGALAPQWFDIPQAFILIRYPSSQPINGLFCFGISLAVFRFIQLFNWMTSRKEWGVLADQHTNSRLAVADNGLTPEAIQTLAYKDVCRSMRASILFPHWLLFVTCFALLIGAIPIFILHLKTLGRQTDLLEALWIPGAVIVAASLIWLLTICSSAFAAYAIQSWYSESMELYAKRHAAALAELSADSDSKSLPDGNQNSSDDPGYNQGWNSPSGSSASGEPDEEKGDYEDHAESRQERARGARSVDGNQKYDPQDNPTFGTRGSGTRDTNNYDGSDDGESFNPTA